MTTTLDAPVAPPADGRPAVQEPARRFPLPPAPPALTAAERAARGKAARGEVSRSSHAVFEPPAARPDPVSLLEEQAATRVPELVPIRYGRMLTSPFAFYRGAALIMASDLASTPTSGLQVQLCGDAHLSNFGVFETPERSQVFDINDFDETLPGPWEWDVKRLIASLEIAGRENGYSVRDRERIVAASAAEYRQTMANFAAMRVLDVWYARMDVATVLERARREIPPARYKLLEGELAKAKTRDHLQAFAKLTETVQGRVRIAPDRPLIVPIAELVPPDVQARLDRQLLRIVKGYRGTIQSDRRSLLDQFQFIELARKVVGVGSVGTRAWIALFIGVRSDDALFLQMKEAEDSVLERFVGRSEYTNHGERVVSGQRIMQATSDIFLGWQRVAGVDGVKRDFYIRQLRDGKYSLDPAIMQPRGMEAYGRLCAWTLSRAHARSGDRIAIAAYLGASDTFDRAMVQFAKAYAEQNQRDFDALSAAAQSGRIQVQAGV